jgi:hypothetical protein
LTSSATGKEGFETLDEFRYGFEATGMENFETLDEFRYGEGRLRNS